MPQQFSIERRIHFGVLFFFVVMLPLSLASQTVEPIDRKKLLSLISERNSKPLLLNIWATWCKPCVEEFPDVIRLSNERTEIDVVAISADFPDEIEEKILPFLKKMNVPFKLYVADFADQDEFFSMFDPQWGGEIPVTFIDDQNGKQTHFLRGKHSFMEFQKAVEEVIRKR
ncbi:MAG: TlpA family protein disulfide reductase [Ignavibacteriales bacterium]|nr:TlpA family protein disulfide reductase [Ignavibacteriales bacterium]